MTTPLTRDRVEIYLTGLIQDKLDGVRVEQLLEHDAALRAELAQAQESLTCWREWVQFVWKDGGPAVGTDAVLQSHVCHEFDALRQQLTQAQAENARLRSILGAILHADERGQGLPFKEAMDKAQAALKEEAK